MTGVQTCALPIFIVTDVREKMVSFLKWPGNTAKIQEGNDVFFS